MVGLVPFIPKGDCCADGVVEYSREIVVLSRCERAGNCRAEDEKYIVSAELAECPPSPKA